MAYSDEGKDEYQGLEDPAYPRNAAGSGRRSSSPALRFKEGKSRGAYLLPSLEEKPRIDPLIRLSRYRLAAAATLAAGAALLAVYGILDTSWATPGSLLTLGFGIGLAVAGGFGLLWLVWKGPEGTQEQLLDDFE
jgi:hypothetical protein